MATLLETWRTQAYGNGLSKADQERLWQEYFALEKGFYEEVLKDPSHVYEGTVKELADHFGIQKYSLLRCLNELKQEGSIRVEGRHILLLSPLIV